MADVTTVFKAAIDFMDGVQQRKQAAAESTFEVVVAEYAAKTSEVSVAPWDDAGTPMTQQAQLKALAEQVKQLAPTLMGP